jgi:hypothetical protein
LYAAWESSVRCRGDAAQVNLLFNRASPWLDLDSYLPYEGKVVIRNKIARKLAVRIPRWVAATSVRSRVNEGDASPMLVGRYLVFDAIQPRDVVTITFPLQETTETYTLKWQQSEFWKESSNPGSSWQGPKEPTRFVCRFRGNTLVDISPRAPGLGYPLYVRDPLRSHQATMRKVSRYLPPLIPAW